MPEIVLTDYSPHPKQAEFHRSSAKFRLLRGAWRAGKTHALVWELIHCAMRTAKRAGPGATFAVFRKTGPALSDTTQKDLLDNIPSHFIVDRKRSEGRVEVTILGGTRVIMRSLDDWKKLGGASFDAVFVDEAWELTLADWQMLKGRLSGKYGPRRMVLATNPPTRNHWLYDVFVEHRQDNMSEHVFSTLDNRENLAPDYLAELMKLQETDPSRFKRFVMGEWGFTAEGQPVYPEFREDVHIAKLEARRGLDFYLNCGWDFGFHHPAVIWGQILPTGHCHLLKEMMGTNEDIRVFARRFKQESNASFPQFPLVHYCDPAGRARNDLGTTSVLELRKEGITPRYRKLRIMQTVQGLRNLIAWHHLGLPMFRVDRSCRMAIDGFIGGYAMDPKTDEPLKDGVFDHVQDAIRYGFAPALLGLSDFQKHASALEARPRVAV